MSLVKCKECGKKISNTSDKCVHCGYIIDTKDYENIVPKKKPVKLIIFIVIVLLAGLFFLFRYYKLNYTLISDSYYRCVASSSYGSTYDDKLSCVYYYFDDEKVYSIRQEVKVLESKEITEGSETFLAGAWNAQRMIWRSGVKELVTSEKFSNDYLTSLGIHNIKDVDMGTYNISKGKITITWERNEDFDAGEIKDGKLWFGDYIENRTISQNKYSYFGESNYKLYVNPLKDYKKWNNCRKEDACYSAFPSYELQ